MLYYRSFMISWSYLTCIERIVTAIYACNKTLGGKHWFWSDYTIFRQHSQDVCDLQVLVINCRFIKQERNEARNMAGYFIRLFILTLYSKMAGYCFLEYGHLVLRLHCCFSLIYVLYIILAIFYCLFNLGNMQYCKMIFFYIM